MVGDLLSLCMPVTSSANYFSFLNVQMKYKYINFLLVSYLFTVVLKFSLREMGNWREILEETALIKSG